MLTELVNSVVNRPYVFGFLAAYLFLSITHLGLQRALLFFVIGYLVAFICEASSIRNGFPFGLYHYNPETFAGELSLAGVPFWDSLSFPFLTYFGWTCALLLFTPLHRNGLDIQLVETKELRRAPRVLLIGALFMAMLDTTIDPITLQGDSWFLGDIYYYPDGGVHFGVPISNYLGWFFVGLTTLILYTIAELLFLPPETGAEKGRRFVPAAALLGPLVYLGIFLFIFIVTLYVGDQQLATASALIYVLPIAMFVGLLMRRSTYATPADAARHLEDFPESPLSKTHFRDGPYSATTPKTDTSRQRG